MNTDVVTTHTFAIKLNFGLKSKEDLPIGPSSIPGFSL